MNTIRHQETHEPHYVHVHARAGAKKESVEQTSSNTWKIAVREKAEQGAANARIRTLLAQTLSTPTQHVRLVNGATSPSKLFLIINNHA